MLHFLEIFCNSLRILNETLVKNVFRYVKSRSDKQLRSKAYEYVTDSCKPEDKANGSAIVPCGLIAWSLFNDTYKFSLDSTVLEVNKKNIAWKSDQDHKFGSDVYPKNFQNGEVIGGAKLNASIPVSSIFTFFCYSILPNFLLFGHKSWKRGWVCEWIWLLFWGSRCVEKRGKKKGA